MDVNAQVELAVTGMHQIEFRVDVASFLKKRQPLP
jgi:hypothetical protein